MGLMLVEQFHQNFAGAGHRNRDFFVHQLVDASVTHGAELLSSVHFFDVASAE